jgi:uncharacterized membrane protein
MTHEREKIMWSLILIQWLHVFSGIGWFGSILYLDFVVIPAVMTLPLEQQRTVSKALTIFAKRVLTPAALLTIILGLARGTISGPVRSWNFLIGTTYGITFLIASLVAVVTFLWGHFAIGRAVRRTARMTR